MTSPEALGGLTLGERSLVVATQIYHAEVPAGVMAAEWHSPKGSFRTRLALRAIRLAERFKDDKKPGVVRADFVLLDEGLVVTVQPGVYYGDDLDHDILDPFAQFARGHLHELCVAALAKERAAEAVDRSGVPTASLIGTGPDGVTVVDRRRGYQRRSGHFSSRTT